MYSIERKDDTVMEQVCNTNMHTRSPAQTQTQTHRHTHEHRHTHRQITHAHILTNDLKSPCRLSRQRVGVLRRNVAYCKRRGLPRFNKARNNIASCEI